MTLDKSKVTKSDVQVMRELGFDFSPSNFVFSMRAAAREIARLRAARRLELLERLQLIGVSAVAGAAVTVILGMVLR